ncbi:MAG TPA: hypothetical protein VJR29_08405 [bacterium]|nr:hypothetical protein [bacterium]
MKQGEIAEEFQLVLAIEKKAAWTYRRLARDCGDPEAKRLLLELARKELDHVRVARQLIRLAEEWRLAEKKSKT